MTALRQAGADVYRQAAALRDITTLGAAAELPLLKELNGGDRQARVNAALALGRLRVVSAVQPLLLCCRQDADPEVRGAAAEALGRIGDRRAVLPLVGQLTAAEAHEMDRRGAAVGLGALQAAEAVVPLTKLLDSANWEERWRAAVALGQIGDPQSRAALAQLASDGNAVVAGCAAWASSVLNRTPNVRDLARNLRGSDDATTWGSAWALGIIGTTAATESLLAALKNGPPTAQAASRTVLAWLGMPMPDAAASPAAMTATVTADSSALMALDERWSDRYGKLDIQVTRPVTLSSRVARPELGAHARPNLYPLQNGELLLVVDPDPESMASPWGVLRSRDAGKTWQVEPTLVRRPAALAALRNGSVLVYDQYLFEKEAQRYVSDLCVSRDNGRSFGPLQLAEFVLSTEQTARRQSRETVEAYKASSARWSEKSVSTFSPRIVELSDDSLVACGLSHNPDAIDPGVFCYRSTDRGLTWSVGATLARDEVAALALASAGENRLVALLATGTQPTLHASFSADAGGTWSPPRSLRLRAGAVDLWRLPSGVLVCAYGDPGVSLMFSVDGTGKSWTDTVRIATAAEGVSGWASLCPAGPDRLLLVYDQQGIFPEIGANPTRALRCVLITATRAKTP